MKLFTIISFFICFALCKDAGILYEVWHAAAANTMRQVKQMGGTQLTTELVVQSNGQLTLDDVYKKYKLDGDIYNVQPRAGFYCIYRKRPNDPSPPIPDCDNITETLTYHASLLTKAGFDYVAIDVTNWPQAAGSDLAVIRPTEVLFEEWLALRQKGVQTPQIAIWPCSPQGSTTWQLMVNTLYNNNTYNDLIYKISGKKVVFIPYNPSCYDAGVEKLIQSNGGRNDIVTIKMWALFGTQDYSQDVWGFFTPCSVSSNDPTYTSAIVGTGDCNQQTSVGEIPEISASGAYMLSQSSLPMANPGKLRGLTIQKFFKKILEQQPPHVFMSSFNEHIGGRQAPAGSANTAFNMGLPNDPQRFSVWVDTYASDFSRDIEPTVEAGSRIYDVAASCVNMYKAGFTCQDHPQEACCTTDDKDIFANIWSLEAPGGKDYLLTNSEYEKDVLKKSGWTEICNPFPNPHVFCVNTQQKDGRAGPFIVYKVPQNNTRPLYRCRIPSTNQHFFSPDSGCENNVSEGILGYVSLKRGGEMLRALKRCLGPAAGTHIHALDLNCDKEDAGVFGYVR